MICRRELSEEVNILFFFFSSRRRHTRLTCDWSSDVCSSDLSLPSLVHAVSVTASSTLNRKLHLELHIQQAPDRKSVVKGKSVDLGGRRIIKKKRNGTTHSSVKLKRKKVG